MKARASPQQSKKSFYYLWINTTLNFKIIKGEKHEDI